MEKCEITAKCGGCAYQGIPYEEQLKLKQDRCEKLLGSFAPVLPIHGMADPLFYRNKVHHAFYRDRKGNIISGSYEAGSHRVVSVSECMLEDRKCQEIIASVRNLLKSFKIQIYNEDNGTGFLRHVLVRRGFASGEIMAVLVAASPVFPSKNNFVKALRKAHPELTTVILNVNDRRTSMVLGSRNITLFGPGFIKDELCGCRFRISPDSFYQVNPVQTEYLYNTAMEFAHLKKTDTVIDAYCGIGTIGLVAAGRAGSVTGVELNPDAVKDAVINAKENGIENARFFRGDAGDFMEAMAREGRHADVVFMDPPRAGSTDQFIDAVDKLSPDKVVYISCNPETLARDLAYFKKKKYFVKRIQPADMFPFTEHTEVICLLVRNTPDAYVRIKTDISGL